MLMSVDRSLAIDENALIRERRLDAICQRFESQWKTASRPSIEDYLGDVPTTERVEAIRELLFIDNHYRKLAGESGISAEYADRYPELYQEILAEAADRFVPLFCGSQNASAHPALPVVPGYTIECELGRGGMGVVFLAVDCRLRRQVVLKMVRDSVLAHPTVSRRFQTEAQAIARLRHPNIVQVYSIGEIEGRPFLVLEYCAGGSLDKRLGGHPIPAASAARLLERIARAVQFAHDQGVIHRDLKPANILLENRHLHESNGTNHPWCDDANPKVSDFGLAKLLENEPGAASPTVTGDRIGTPSYMAPEQAAGQMSNIGPETDVYALGAILYELLTGRPPFLAASSISALQHVIKHDPVPPRQLQPGVPRDLEIICLKCLEKLPERRYATAAALADDLRRYQAGEPICARPPSRWQKLARWIRIHPTQTAIAVCLLLGLAGQSIGLILLHAARQQAESYLSQALEVTRDTMNLVNDDSEMTDLGHYTLRDKVVTSLMEKGEAILSQSPGNQLLIRELARACAEKSQISHRLGDTKSAATAAERAHELFCQLVEQDGHRFTDRIDLAQCHIQRARQLGDAMDLPSALAQLRHADVIVNQVLDVMPQDASARFTLAEALLLTAEYEGSDAPRSADLLQRASDQITRALQQSPKHPRGIKIGGQIWQRVATRTRGFNRSDEEKQRHGNAMLQLRQLRATNSTNVELEVEYGRTLLNICGTLCDEGYFEQALPVAEEGAAIFHSLTRSAPEIRSHRWHHALIVGNRAEILAGLGQFEAAERDYAYLTATLATLLPYAKENWANKHLCTTMRAYHDIARYRIHRRQFDQGIEMIESAERIEPTSSLPGDPVAHYLRPELIMLRATILDQTGRHRESMAAWMNAKASPDCNHQAAACVGWVVAASGAGETEDAMTHATTLLQDVQLDKENYFDLARALARCSAAFTAGEDRNRVLSLCVCCLEQARRRNCFSNAYQIQWRLANHPDFAFVRNERDFQSFLHSLSNPANSSTNR